MTTESNAEEPSIGTPANVGDEEAARNAERVDAEFARALAESGLGWISHT